MKRVLLPIIAMLFISCATTKNFDTNNMEIVSEDRKTNSVHYIETIEHVEAMYEPNVSMIMFDCFGMPFLVTGLFIKETGRVIVYSVANIPLGIIDGIIPPDLSTHGGVPITDEKPRRWMPDVEGAKKELDELNKEYENTDYFKYKKYAKRWSKTTLNVNRVVKEINWDGTTNIIQTDLFTFVYIGTVNDSIKRVSKKSSLVGKKVGKVTAEFVSYPMYKFGVFLGKN